MNAQIKVSIIVPVYNSADYIDKCVQSLIGQTLQDIEIILIDDASTDNSLEILRQYEKQYPQKIIVIASPENRRQGGARNLGIEAAKGEYLGFVDSDDWAEPNMYELLYNEAIKQNSDLCYCFWHKINEKNEILADKTNYSCPTGKITEKTRKQMLINHLTSVPCCIYRSVLFTENNIRFPEKLRYEDMLIDPLVIPLVQHIAAVEQPLYNYFIHSNSTMTEINETKFRDKQQVCKMIVEEYKKRGFYEKYREEINYLYFRKGYIHTALNYIINAQKPDKKVIVELRNALLEIDKNYRKDIYYKQKLSFRIIDRMLDNKLLINILKMAMKLFKFNI